MNLLRKAELAVALISAVSMAVSAADAGNSMGKQPEQKTRVPFRICVMDFDQADVAGQRRFLDQNSNPIVIPPQCTLQQADRMSINAVMQGFVRMIDARDNARTNEFNRRRVAGDNLWEREKALALYRTIVNGPSRPVILGAERFSAMLSRHNDLFSCTDATVMISAMAKLQQAPDFPQDFFRRLAAETGATHLLFGTVSDLRIKTKTFSGYGIETTSSTYELDFTCKLLDLNEQRTVYGNVFTGVKTERRLPGVFEKESALFQTLLNDALSKAAEDLYQACKPGENCRMPAPVLLQKEKPAPAAEPAAAGGSTQETK